MILTVPCNKLKMCDLKDMVETAIKLCESSKKTLIFANKTKFIPSLKTLCDFKEKIFFTDKNQIFEKLIENFEIFQVFILVEADLNNFEREFIDQLRKKFKKQIIELK